MGGSGVQRPLKFAKYLRRFGWNPIILCPEPGAYHTFDESLLNELEELDLTTHRVAADTPFHKIGGSPKSINLPEWLVKPLRKISSIFWFPDNKKGWIEPAFKKAEEIITANDIELIFSTAPPYSNLLLGKKIKQKYNIPLLFDMRDDWLHSHLNKYSAGIYKRKMKLMESETLETSDFLITINDKILQGIRNRIKSINTVNSCTITHGFDPEDFENDVVTSQKKHSISFLYSGVFYEDSNPKIFLNAIYHLLKENEELKERVKLKFQGRLRSEDKKLIQILGLEEITTDFGYLKHKEAVVNLREADILWLNVGQKKHADKISLGKSSEYFATKKPILGLVPDGEAKKLLLKYKAGFIADPYSVSEVKKQIQQIINDFDTNKLPKPDNEFIQKFDILSLTEDLSEVFTALTRNSRVYNKD